MADHEQRSPGPDGRSERGEKASPGLGRQLHELGRDEVERAMLGRTGQKVGVSPVDTRGKRRVNGPCVLDRARGPRWKCRRPPHATRAANQMASAPSPHPTSRARPGSMPSTSATSCGLGFPLQMRADD